MHQILLLDELVRNIAYCADRTTQGSASLLALACCCKLLEGPVMDILWQRQVHLSTILKTLPADSWSITDDIFSLSRNLSREEWERFRKYAARVTKLGVPKMSSQYGTLPSRPRAWVSAETIQLLGMESQRGGFWPRLFLLECNIDWEIVPFISSFLSPTITDLDLTLPRENNRLLQPTLSLLTHTCRQLQSLKVDVDTSDPPSGAEMGRLISVSRHTLHRINIRPSTPPEIFPVIFDLPLLRSLTLQEPRLPNQFPPGILPPLETIYLNGSHGPNLTQFLRRLSVQRLVAVSVYCGEIIQLSMFLDSLCGATQTANYLYLSPVSAFDRFSITLLRTFTNLTYLTIRCVCECREMSWPCSFQLTDEDLLDLGGALPYIRTLGLGPGCHRPCHATFKSLTCLSRMCGNLENLLIRVDFASIVDSSDQPNHSNTSLRVDDARPQRERSRLSMLMIGNSPLPDTPRCEWLVALALATIFPSIKLLISSCPGGMGKRWSRVRGDIRICRKIFHITQGEETTPTL